MKKLTQKLRQYVVLLISLLIVSSCDSLIECSFQLKNESAKEIKVAYSVEGKDSMILIPANSSKELFNDKSVGKAKVDKYTQTMSLFQYILIEGIPADSLAYLPRAAWTMQWKNNYQVVYALTLKK